MVISLSQKLFTNASIYGQKPIVFPIMVITNDYYLATVYGGFTDYKYDRI